MNPEVVVVSHTVDADPSRIQTRADLARELTTARTRAGLTVRELANRLGMPSATIGGYLSGRHMPSTAQVQIFRDLLIACGIADAGEHDEWVAALGRARSTSDGRAPRTAPPYRGLEAFQPTDAALFFGRAKLTQHVLDRLKGLRDGPSDGQGLLLVVGPSGSGKSSLLRAGVAAAVAAGALDTEGRSWRSVVFTPGESPLAALDRGLEDVGQAPVVIVVDQFEEVFTAATEKDRAEFIARLVSMTPHSRLGVLGMRADFYAAAAREPQLVPVLQDCQVIVAPMTEAELKQAIVGPARSVGVTVDDGLVDLLVADLAPRGRSRHAHDAGALPLLSHALLATWERARRNQLTIADYRDSGGIDGAIQQTAEDLYSGMTGAEQELTRRIFIRLVTFDDDMIATRRRIRRTELDELVQNLDDVIVDADTIVDRFVAHRMITADTETVEVSHEALLSAWPRLGDWLDADRAGLRLHRQLTNAANSWSESGRDDGLLLRGGQLAAMSEWAADPQNRAGLNRAERDLVDVSVDSEQRERRAARRRTRTLQRLLAAVGVLALVATGLGGYGLHARSVANAQRHVATLTRDQALSREVANEVTQVRTFDSSLAAQLALAAYRISPTAEARSALIDSSAKVLATRILGPTGPTAIAINPAGTILAIGHADGGSVRLYQLRTGYAPRSLAAIPGAGGANQVFGLAFSPDGRVLATAGSNGELQLWNVTSTTRPVALGVAPGRFRGAVQGVAFSPDGGTMVAIGQQPGALLWRMSGVGRATALPALQGLPASVGSDPLNAEGVAFSPDGRVLAIGSSDGDVRLWHTSGMGSRMPITLVTSSAAVDALSFSPNGDVLAAADKNGAVNLWNVGAATPKRAHALLTGFTSWATAVAFTPDGAQLIAGSSDKGVHSWNTSTWQQDASREASGPITGVDLTPDGRTLVTSSGDGSVRLWPAKPTNIAGLGGPAFVVAYSGNGKIIDTTTSGPNAAAALWDGTSSRPHRLGPDIVPPRGFGAAAGSSAISANGRLVAIGGRTGDVSLWDVTDPTRPRVLSPDLTGATALIEALAFSPNGRLLAAGSDDGAVHLWDVSRPGTPRVVARLDTGGIDGEALGVAFSPNGQLLAAASTDKKVYLWRITSAPQPVALGPLSGFSNYAWAVTFSPDGNTLAASSADHTTLLWNVAGPGRPSRIGPPLTGPTDYAVSVAYSPDGRTLAVGSNDSTEWLWDVTDRSHPVLLATLRAAVGGINASAFSPVGSTLAATGGGGQVFRWQTDVAAVSADICRMSGSRITPSEWSQYLPGAPYDPPCG